MPQAGAASSILISRILPDEVIAFARSRADVDLHTGDHPLSKADLKSRLRSRWGLVCLITDTIDAEVLAASPELKVVSNVAVGYNNIDVAAATRAGVVVTNTPDVLTEEVADTALSLLLMTVRELSA